MRSISYEKTTHLGKRCVTMTDLMDKFYETTELSDVICDECSKSICTAKKSRIKNKSKILIDNKQNLCKNGGLHPMTARKGKYIPVNVYIYMKDTFKKIGSLIVCWDLIQVKESLISLTMTYQIAI